MAAKKPAAPSPVYAAAKQAYLCLNEQEREFVDSFLRLHDFKLVCEKLKMDEQTATTLYARPSVHHACIQIKMADDLSWSELAIQAKTTLMEVMMDMSQTGIVRTGAAKTALECISKTNPHLLAEMGGQEMGKEAAAALVLGDAMPKRKDPEDEDEVVESTH